MIKVAPSILSADFTDIKISRGFDGKGRRGLYPLRRNGRYVCA